jgi:hypothetical protein
MFVVLTPLSSAIPIWTKKLYSDGLDLSHQLSMCIKVNTVIKVLCSEVRCAYASFFFLFLHPNESNLPFTWPCPQLGVPTIDSMAISNLFEHHLCFFKHTTRIHQALTSTLSIITPLPHVNMTTREENLHGDDLVGHKPPLIHSNKFYP